VADRVLLAALLVERFGPDAVLKGDVMSETLELSADETAAIKRMYCGETGDTSTTLRWVARDTVDEWRRGHVDLLVVTRVGGVGLWGTLVKSTWEGEWDDLHPRDRVTLVPVEAVPSVTYRLAVA